MTLVVGGELGQLGLPELNDDNVTGAAVGHAQHVVHSLKGKMYACAIPSVW